MTDNTQQLAKYPINVVVIALLFTYLLMLGAGNFNLHIAFEDLIPIGLALSYWKILKSHG